MSSPYPRDDFDAVTPPLDGRRGAHRAAPRRSTRVLAPLVVAAVVAVAGGVGYLALSPTSSTTASASTAQDDAAAAAAAGADDATDDASASASASATQAVDQTVPVVVLNGTGTKGLAATTQAELEKAGWTVSSTGNATTAQRSAHQGTTVLYPSAELEATATALSLALHGSAALDPAATAGTLTVVLLP